MTTPTNWPDPARPGVPMFPEKRGWHMLDRNMWEWCPTQQAWNDEVLHPSFVKAMNMAWRKYYGPVLSPVQIAEMLAAERERCAKVCDKLKSRELEVYSVGLYTTAAERTIRAYESAACLIRKL